MVNTYIRLTIVFAAKDGEALYSQQKQPEADCCSDHELLIAKFRLKLKKVGKTTRPFRYDLNFKTYSSKSPYLQGFLMGTLFLWTWGTNLMNIYVHKARGTSLKIFKTSISIYIQMDISFLFSFAFLFSSFLSYL